jgi:hypothetical protein
MTSKLRFLKSLLACLALETCLFGLSQSFAALTVVPTGQQTFDISTGVTDLPEGGKIIDESQKLSLSAEQMSFKEGSFIKAAKATVTGEFGSLNSPSIFIDLSTQELNADTVELHYKNIVITGTHLKLFLKPNIARLDTEVSSSDPQFIASSLLINLKTGDALLVSPYSFQNGPLALKQENEGKNLQLSPVEAEDGSLSYQASSVVEENLLASFEPYLNP